MSTNNVITISESTAAESAASLAAESTSSLLKNAKYIQNVHWWYFGPVLLAIVMFLLVGTIFERRIESLWRRVLERRQAVLTQRAENQQPLLNANSLHTVKTPSQRTIGSCKAGTTTTSGDNDGKLETRSFCCDYAKIEHRDDDLFKKDTTERTVSLLPKINTYLIKDLDICEKRIEIDEAV